MTTSTAPNPTSSTTIQQLFQQLGLPLWWQNVTQAWGQNGEKGTDFGLGGFGKPVGSIVSGKVVYVGNGGYPGSSIGQIVQIQTANGLIHYQHLMSSSVQVGQTVQPGTVIGTGGGCPTGCYPPGLVGNGCSCYDQYSTGQHIEVRWSPTYNPSGGVWSQAWQSPMSQFQQLVSGSTTGNPGVPTGGGPGGIFGIPASLLASITQFFTTGISFMTGIQSNITSLQTFFAGFINVFPWLTNPLRIVKMLAGIAMVIVALYMLVSSNPQVQQAVKTAAKAAEVAA